jgi:hypothetical protein
MNARRRVPARPLPAGWTRTDATTINGRHVTKGTELSITGLRGRWTFGTYTVTPTASWLDVYRDGRSRTVRPDAVKIVHRRPA